MTHHCKFISLFTIIQLSPPLWPQKHNYEGGRGGPGGPGGRGGPPLGAPPGGGGGPAGLGLPPGAGGGPAQVK